MKKLSTAAMVLFVALAASTANAQTETVNITGKAAQQSGTIYLENYANRTYHVLDSTKIVDGTFKFTRALALPEHYGLSIDTAAIAALNGQRHPDQLTLPLFLGAGENNISVVFDTVGYFANSKITGSATTDLFNQAYKASTKANIADFVKQNPASIVTAYILFKKYSSVLQPAELKELASHLSPTLANTQYVKELNKAIETAPIGSKAIDFTLPNIAGNPVSLKSKLGKKYVLLQFWASWCPICRRDNPELAKVYDRYKTKGFDIYAVSLDRNKGAWTKAIADYKLNQWTNVSDLSLWNSSAIKLYGFRATPSNVLIDPQGNIIAKNIFGAELDQKLAQLLSSN
jgi:peroxiredoxin